MSDVKICNNSKSSDYLVKQVSNSKKQFIWRWNGDLVNLKLFFDVLELKGIWTNPPGSKGAVFKTKTLSLTWYPSTKTLLSQGKDSAKFISVLEDVIKNPRELIDNEESETETKSTSKDSSSCNVHNHNNPQAQPDVHASSSTGSSDSFSESNLTLESKTKTDHEIQDGLIAGSAFKSILADYLRHWCDQGADIYLVSPFLDQVAVQFLIDYIPIEDHLKAIYVRHVCSWDNKKLENVLLDAGATEHWIVKKIHCLRKTPSFHAKFYAGRFDDKVELVITSCNLTKEHLFSQQLETLLRKTLCIKEFEEEWLKPVKELYANEQLKCDAGITDMIAYVQKLTIGND